MAHKHDSEKKDQPTVPLGTPPADEGQPKLSPLGHPSMPAEHPHGMQPTGAHTPPPVHSPAGAQSVTKSDVVSPAAKPMSPASTHVVPVADTDVHKPVSAHQLAHAAGTVGHADLALDFDQAAAAGLPWQKVLQMLFEMGVAGFRQWLQDWLVAHGHNVKLASMQAPKSPKGQTITY